MSIRQLRSDEARRDWRDMLDEVQRSPAAAIEILRYDKPVAVVVSAEWFRATLDYIGHTVDAGRFLGDYEVIHKDGNPRNNEVTNLELRESPEPYPKENER